MKRKTTSQFGTGLRVSGLVAALGLAALLAAALLFGIQDVRADGATTAAPRLSVGPTQRVTAPTATLLVATAADFPPMEYISGTQFVGHDIDLMAALATEMGVTVVYTNVPWDALFTGLRAGQFDAVISSVSIVPARQESLDFTLPYAAFRYEDWEVDDVVGIMVQKDNRALRRQMNEALWQLRDDGSLATIVAAIAADLPDWQPHLPDWPVVSPEAGGTVVFTDTEQVATIVQVPGGAVSETTLLAYTPVHTATAPAGLSFAGRAFDLDVFQSGAFLPAGLDLPVPATVTVHYTETDVIGLDEASLVLNRWDEVGQVWVDAACLPYDRHPADNWLVVPVCHLSQFALLGEPQYTVYLPLVQQMAP
jgi:hypothetical protein